MEEIKSSNSFKFIARIALMLCVSVLGIGLYKLGFKIFEDKLKENMEFLLVGVAITIPLFLFLLINYLGIKESEKNNIHLALVALVLTIGSIIAFALLSLKKPPEKKERAISAPLLNAVKVSSETVKMIVSGYGTVQPRSHVQVVPQVSGRVVECHDQWVDGGFFKAGEPLIQIEKVDYELAVQNAEAAVAQAEVKLQQEQAEALTARTEWEKLHPGQEPPSALVLRQPQIKTAQAQLKAAQAQLEEAKLNLKRTAIAMPFDGRIVSTNIDTGQFVTTGAPIAMVYRTDLVEITVPLANEDLAWFQVPLSMNDGRQPNAYNSSPVQVFADFAGRKYTWQGRVVRTEGEIDARSRLVPVVVQVNDPFAVKNGDVPLTPGMFVTVDIEGRQVDNVLRVPRYAVHNGSEVWVAQDMPQEDRLVDNPSTEESEKQPDNALGDSPVNDEDVVEASIDQPSENYKQLNIHSVKIIRMDKEYAYISEGLKDEAVVIISPLETVTDGMRVRINLETPEQIKDPLQEKSL